MQLLSVIRRWHYRDHFSIPDNPTHRSVEEHGPQIPGASDRAAEPSSTSLIARASWTHTPTTAHAATGGEVAKAEADDQSNCIADLAASVTRAPTTAWRPSLAPGRPLGNRNRRRAAGVFSRCSCRARRSSSIGRKIGRSSSASDQIAGRSLQASHSRAFISAPHSQKQTHEMLFDAHNHAFRVLRGVPRKHSRQHANCPDKIGRGKERQVNPLLCLFSHACTRRVQSRFRLGEGADREKRPGRAPSAWAAWAPHFPSLDALNDWLRPMPRALGIDATRPASAGTSPMPG